MRCEARLLYFFITYPLSLVATWDVAKSMPFPWFMSYGRKGETYKAAVQGRVALEEVLLVAQLGRGEGAALLHHRPIEVY